jgi:glycosyltransferase involved in cell wall biosynthesis
MNKLAISAVFPAYNDALALPGLIETAFATLTDCASEFEVIVVNDGSADETGEVLEKLRQSYGGQLKVLTHERNRGYGSALRTGFSAATLGHVFYTDGDGQYDVAELKNLLAKFEPGTVLVNGFKALRSDPWYRVVAGAAYRAMVRRAFRLRLKDVDCDFRLIRTETLQQIDFTSTSGTICVELVYRLERTGETVSEVPVHHYPRRHGRSQFFRVRPLFDTFVQLIRLYRRLEA